MKPFVLALAVLFFAAPALAADRVEERDADMDGRKETRIFSDAQGRVTRVVVDKNNDKKPDLTAFYKDGYPERGERDTDFDGVVDAWIVYDRQGYSTEVAYDEKRKDRKADRWVFMKKGRVVRQEFDRNFDGKPDLRLLQDGGRLLRKEYDDNFDGRYETVREAPLRGTLDNTQTTPPEASPKAPK